MPQAIGSQASLDTIAQSDFADRYSVITVADLQANGRAVTRAQGALDELSLHLRSRQVWSAHAETISKATFAVVPRSCSPRTSVRPGPFEYASAAPIEV